MRHQFFRKSRSLSWITLCTAFGATQAQADWQYTKWGMAKDQVLLASNGALFEVMKRRAGNPYVGLTGKYETGTYIFDAAMLFDAGDTLVGVRLSQHAARECRQTLGDLTAKYGSAQDITSTPGNPQLTWNDNKSGNQVTYDGTPRHGEAMSAGTSAIACTVLYVPLTRASSNGL